MSGILKIFFGSRYANPWIVLICLLLAGFFEGIGIASLLPMLSLAMGDFSPESSPVNRIVVHGLGAIGLSPDLKVLLTLVVGGMVLKGLVTFAVMRYVGHAVADVATSLRAQLIRALLSANWAYFTDQPLGRVANAMSVDATRAGQAYMMAAVFLAFAIRTTIYTAVAFLISWRLALAALAMGGVIALSLHFLVKIARKAGRRQTERTSELVMSLSDALGNIKPLKAMAKQARFSDLFDKKIGQLKKALRRQVTSQYALRNLQEILIAIAIGLGFYGANVYWNVPVSELLVMGLLLFQTVLSIGKIQAQFQKAVLLESPYWAMRELITAAEAASEPNPGTRTPTLESGCRLQGVTFAHGEKPVLEGVSLEIPAKQLTVITGASGSGKSTITDLLLGLYRPWAGEVLVDEVPLSEIDLQRWRGMIGYVPQELLLFHDTILANVNLGDPNLGEAEVTAALKAAGLWHFVASLPNGVRSHVGEKGAKLSGGQRQRIALARALAGGPELLILDEVTSALDPQTEKEICDNISALLPKVTILVITHRPVWTDSADLVYHLDDRGLHLVKPQPALQRQA